MPLDRNIYPAVHPFSPVAMPLAATENFGPDVTLHIVNAGDLPMVRVSTLWDGGSHRMPTDFALPFSNEYGNRRYFTAQILAAMMSENTRRHNAAEIAEIVDSCGAWLGAYSRRHHMGVTTLMPAECMETILDMAREIITEPVFTPEAFETIRRRMCDAEKLKLTSPVSWASEQIKPLIAGYGHPYYTQNNEQGVEDVALDDVNSLKDTLLMRTPIHIFAAGKLGASQLRVLRAYAGKIATEMKGHATLTPFAPMQSEAPQHMQLHQTATLQTAIVAAMPLPTTPQHPDFCNLVFTVHALGGYFGARLMTNIREQKGLTYGISATVLPHIEGPQMLIKASCKKDSTQQVIDEIRNEITRLHTTPPDADEMQRLTGHIATSLMSKLDSPFTIMDYYLNGHTTMIPPDDFARKNEALVNLDSRTVADMAQRYLNPDSLRIVTVEQ